MNIWFYLIIAGLVTFTDLTVAYLLFKRKKPVTRNMLIAVLLAAVMEVTYTISAVTDSYMIMKVALAAFFSTVPVMLFFLERFFVDYLQLKNDDDRRHRQMVLLAAICIDVVFQFLNPYNEMVMQFKYEANSIVKWAFMPQDLYKLHLILCYIVIGVICYNLIKRTTQTPSVYRSKYYALILGLIVCVAVNGVCIMAQTHGSPDYSQISYSMLALILYWDIFHNSQKTMLNSVRNVILNELKHPIILFGEGNKIAICNEAISFMTDPLGKNIQKAPYRSELTMEEFLKRWNMNPELAATEEDNTYFQWNYRGENHSAVYRVDFSAIKDRKDNVIGRMLAFTDMSLDIDLLTEFNSKIAFERYFAKDKVPASRETGAVPKTDSDRYPMAVAICDINGLSRINAKYGEDEGDKCIKFLADAMRRFMPEGTYFARLHDAHLLAVSEHTTNREMHEYLKKIEIECRINGLENQGFTIQSAVCIADENEPDIPAATESAAYTLKSLKLLDRSSAHSSLVDSFAQTLLESDEGTEAHVMRTQKLGDILGKRLDFTDKQLSDLSLLCLLHDIGKLGIPLEILNKPGKLTREEWALMKSHTHKGYRIAMASPELRGIAEYILHHHERWDGKGYPDGISMESIPLLSRVIAILDAYDAMVNDRPYHRAVSKAQAKAELKRCAGTQFDPFLVAEFVLMLDETEADCQDTSGADEDLAIDQADAVQLEFGIKDADQLKSENDDVVARICFSEYKLDSEERIIEIDDAFTELTGYTREDLSTYNLTQWDLIPKEDLERYRGVTSKCIESEGRAYLEHRLRRKDGSGRNIFCIGSRKYDVVGKREYSSILIFDADNTLAAKAIREEEREIARRSMKTWENIIRKDSLTGILNHEAFVNDFESALMKNDGMLCMLIMDIDYFKEYNDTYGHVDGDVLLRIVAKTLQNNMKENDFTGRLGGDEFAAVISVKAASEEDAEKQLRSRVEEIFNALMTQVSSIPKSATVSIGATIIRSDEHHFRRIYQAADMALYKSKEKGRKCFTINRL